MNTEPIVGQLRDCAVSLSDFGEWYHYNPDPFDIVGDNEHFHVGYDAENDRPVYCCMEDLVAGDEDVRSYIVCYGKYSPIRIEFLSQTIRPFCVWGVLCNNVFPVKTEPCINYEDDYAEKLAKWFQGYMGFKLGQLVKVNQESCFSKFNDWFYGKIGVVKGVFLATVNDDVGRAYSLLCAQLSAVPQWSAYAAQTINSVERKDVLVPLHFLEPVPTEKKKACRLCRSHLPALQILGRYQKRSF